jgi:hypothetical protein
MRRSARSWPGLGRPCSRNHSPLGLRGRGLLCGGYSAGPIWGRPQNVHWPVTPSHSGCARPGPCAVWNVRATLSCSC